MIEEEEPDWRGRPAWPRRIAPNVETPRGASPGGAWRIRLRDLRSKRRHPAEKCSSWHDRARLGDTPRGVFYEKAPRCQAALAAFPTCLRRSVCPRVFYPHSRGVLRWTRCIMGCHRSGAAISAAASKAKTPSAVADNGGSTRTPIDSFPFYLFFWPPPSGLLIPSLHWGRYGGAMVFSLAKGVICRSEPAVSGKDVYKRVR
jgi:hypothetical protein